MTKSSRLVVGFMLIIIGLLAGVLLTANLNLTHSGRASSDSEARTRLEEKMESMSDFSDGFAAVAEYVTPSVVTVETEKTVQMANSPFGDQDPFGDFFGQDDFFRRFFGTPRNQPRQEQKLSGLGSGVIVSADGYILTNNHVIDNTDKISITLSNGKVYEGKLIGTDSRTDIAVVKIDEKGLPAIKISNSDQIKVGQWAIAVGNPFQKALSHTVTAGIISGVSRSSVGLDTDVDFLQTDAAINPGNSGGALVNLKGELLGINTAILSRSGGYQGIGFAIPSNTAKNIMDQLIKSGKVIRGYVGVSMQDVNDQMAKALGLKENRGAVIAQVMEGSPADRANLKAGDVIIKVNDKEVTNGAEIRKQIISKAPGEKVKITVVRDGKPQTVEVTLGEVPAEPVAVKKDESLKKSSERLGMEVSGLSRDLATRYGINPKLTGVVITSIDQNGPSFAAGLREGDLIQRVGRKDIASVKEFSEEMANVAKGETVLFLINRQGSSLFIAFNLMN
ncbi:MAG: DegQ family serine endoprotease [Bacteroidetes bacterium]|nr:DegQ family serine endoprotease [Bacteroidota bacterium]